MDSLHQLLMAAHTLFKKGVFAHLDGTGLTMGQPKVLDRLSVQDGQAQKDLAAACFIEPASLTRILNGMEAKGLVKRLNLEGNRKTSYVFMTEKGHQAAKTCAQVFENMEHTAFMGISKAEQAQFMATLAKIYDNLCEERNAR